MYQNSYHVRIGRRDLLVAFIIPLFSLCLTLPITDFLQKTRLDLSHIETLEDFPNECQLNFFTYDTSSLSMHLVLTIDDKTYPSTETSRNKKEFEDRLLFLEKTDTVTCYYNNPEWVTKQELNQQKQAKLNAMSYKPLLLLLSYLNSVFIQCVYIIYRFPLLKKLH